MSEDKCIFVTDMTSNGRLYVPMKERHNLKEGDKIIVLIVKIDKNDLLKLFGGKS